MEFNCVRQCDVIGPMRKIQIWNKWNTSGRRKNAEGIGGRVRHRRKRKA